MLLQKLKYRFYLAKIKRKTPLNSSSKISHFGLFYKGKFETEARILAMRLALRGCWRPCYSRKFFCYFCLRYYVKFYDWNAIENSIIHTGKITIYNKVVIVTADVAKSISAFSSVANNGIMTNVGIVD